MLVVPDGLWLVALRKESVDRNSRGMNTILFITVALRKESVDRNHAVQVVIVIVYASLSARRAWIEITVVGVLATLVTVALRKESVDRNQQLIDTSKDVIKVALRKESVDRNSA